MNISKTLQRIFLVLAVSAVFSAQAFAEGEQSSGRESSSQSSEHRSSEGERGREGGDGERGGQASPEIDATSGTSAITLLTGALALAWRRSRSPQAAKSS
jgi:hypothetical protein